MSAINNITFIGADAHAKLGMPLLGSNVINVLHERSYAVSNRLFLWNGVDVAWSP